MKATEHIHKLGLTAKDKVTGFTGVIDSVSFDLFGCIQYLLQPQAKEGVTHNDARWYDANRVEITPDSRVMAVPEYDLGYDLAYDGLQVSDIGVFKNENNKKAHISAGNKGPSEKPIQ